MLLVTAGHLGPVQGWAAPDLQHLLDGALAPLRNVHKFDPIIRLPMVLGLAVVLDGRRRAVADAVNGGAGEPASPGLLNRGNQLAVVAMVLLAVVGSVCRRWRGASLRPARLLDVPQYWRQAASGSTNDDGTALLVPGANFANYAWGVPRDEPLQYLRRQPVGCSQRHPADPAGQHPHARRGRAPACAGEGSPGLAAYLRRAGVPTWWCATTWRRRDDVPCPWWCIRRWRSRDSPGWPTSAPTSAAGPPWATAPRGSSSTRDGRTPTQPWRSSRSPGATARRSPRPSRRSSPQDRRTWWISSTSG